jgi:hypothetical protein
VTLLRLESTKAGLVRSQNFSSSYTHSSNDFDSKANWSINKTIESETFIISKLALQASTGANADYYIENVDQDYKSSYYLRRISSSSKIRSISTAYVEQDRKGYNDYTIRSRTDSGTVSVDSHTLDFDLRDEYTYLIGSFSAYDDATNISSTQTYTQGKHKLLNATVEIKNGTKYFITASASFRSTSGNQQPTYFVNSSDLDEGACYSKKEARVDSTDYVNTYIYTVCDGVDVGENYTFNLWLEVPSGETVEHIDEAIAGIELSGLDAIQLNVAPLVGEIYLNATSTENLTTDNLTISYVSSDPNGDDVKNITNWYVNENSITVLNMPFESFIGDEDSLAIDYSSYKNNGTVTGASWNNDIGYDGFGAYGFENNDKIEVPYDSSFDFDLNESYTINAWINMRDDGDNKELIHSPNGAGRYSFRVYYSSAGGTFRLVIYNGSSSNFEDNSFAGYFDKWTMTTLVKNSTHLCAYFDGSLVSACSQVTIAGSTLGGSGDLHIGQHPSNVNDFNGTIDDVMIFNRALSPELISLMYSNNSNVIPSQDTNVLENWYACVVPNDNIIDGNEKCSNNITIKDIYAPEFENAVNSSIDFRIYSNFTANITITDHALSHYIFSTNADGTWTNKSAVQISGTSYLASELVNITRGSGEEICWYYWANDTTGNSNSSEVYCFTVENTPLTHSVPYIGTHEPSRNYLDSDIVAYWKFENKQQYQNQDNSLKVHVFQYKELNV